MGNDKKKLYIEVSGGLVQSVLADKELNIEVVVCDRDSAAQEIPGDGFEFQNTKACEELDIIKTNERYHVVW